MRHLYLIILMAALVSCRPSGSDPDSAAGNTAGESSGKASTLAVEVKTLTPEEFVRHFEVTGNMEAVKDAIISPEINGQIKTIAVERGQRVRKGELLIGLNTDVTEKSIAEVKTNLELASKIYEKQKELWDQNIGSELQYLEAKNGKESLEGRLATLEKQMEMARIRAPFSGIVDNIMVREGELASPGMRLLHLVNLAEMRVSARVSESYLQSVKKGDPVQLRFSSYPDEVLAEKISRLGQVIDDQTRTFALEILFANKDEKYKPNMLTSVRIEDYRNDKALVVPSIVLKQDFNGTFLFVISEGENGSVARKQYVSPGVTVQDKTMIEEGLSAGDMVIIKGYNLVSDGSPVDPVQL